MYLTGHAIEFDDESIKIECPNDTIVITVQKGMLTLFKIKSSKNMFDVITMNIKELKEFCYLIATLDGVKP